MERTLIQLKSDFADMADKHKQINSFFWGNFVDAINQDAVDYPLMCCTLQPSQIGDSYTGVDLQVIICDKYNEQDYRMIDEVHSDMLRILKDIDVTLKQFRFQDYLDVETDFSTEPFINEGQDITAGWGGLMRMRIHDYENRCAIPYDGFDFDGSTTGTGCPSGVVVITDDEGNTLYTVTVDSNGNEVQVIQDSTVTLNTNQLTTSVNAEGSKNFNLLDQNGDPVNVDSVSGDDVTLFAEAINPDAFIIKIATQESGVSADNQFTIPCRTPFYSYDYNVDTSDGQTFTGQSGDLTITFPKKGVYTIAITENSTGGFPSIYFNNGGDRLKLLEVVRWGNNKWQGFTASFRGCSNFDVTAKDSPDLSLATQIDNLALSASRFFGNIAFANTDTSNITDFTQTFRSSKIAVDLSNWDVSSAITMQQMFVGAPLFDFDLGSWNLSLSLSNISNIFASSGMSTENYTDTIVGWANYVFNNGGSPSGVDMSNQNGMTFDTSRSGGANFADAGAARTYLTGTALWTISGDTII